MDDGARIRSGQYPDDERGQSPPRDPGIEDRLAAHPSTLGARRFGTIRSRLLVAFVAMVLLPAIVIIVVSAVGQVQSGRQQVIAQLESVATLKEAEIGSWIDRLQVDLPLVLFRLEADELGALLRGELSPTDRLRIVADLEQLREKNQVFEEVFLTDSQGRVVLSTDADQEGKLLKNEIYFRRGLEGPYVHPPSYSPSLGRLSVIFVQPIVDGQGETVGVVAGRASTDVLESIMLERAGLGDTGETYIVGANHALLTASRFGEQGIYVRTPGANAAIDNRVNDSGLYENYQGVPVVGVYHWLPELQVALLAEQSQSESFGGLYRTLGVNAGVALASVLLAVVASLFVTRSISQPLTSLAETSTRIAAGDLTLTSKVTREDEIGALAQAFNSMTGQLRDLIGGLEQRVADRTRELARRSAYLEASADVARAAGSVLDAEELVRQTVDLIRERFGLYYVGLFLIDEAKEWAVLHAGTGEAGRTMLARGHRLRIGGESMVGWSIVNQQARIAQLAKEDAVRLATPELPETRAEAALPLRSRGEVIGALTVQSDQAGAFDQDTITVLQTMADQVAVAIDNARLFSEAEEALAAERRAYGQLSRDAWRELLQAESALGFLSRGQSTIPAGDLWRQEMETAFQTDQITLDDESGTNLAIPLRLGGQVIGVAHGRKSDGSGQWTTEEIQLVKTLSEQLTVALESARLYEETQRRASRERLIGEVTSRMRESLEMDTLLRTAASEMRRALDLEDLVVRLAPPGTDGDPARDVSPIRAEGGTDDANLD